MALLRKVLTAIAISLIAFPAAAGLSYHTDSTPDGLRYVVIEGDISFEDNPERFTVVVRSHNPTVVVFNSPGGNIVRAMELGRLIRAFGLRTLQPRGLDCSSACALAFMGGVDRYADPGAIGVHKSSFGPDFTLSAAEAVSAVQQLTAEVISYMLEMGIDPSLLQLSLQYERDDIRYLSRSEMQRYRVISSGEPSNSQHVAIPSPQHPTPSPSRESHWPGTSGSTASLMPRTAPALPTAQSGRVLHPKGSAPVKLRADGDSKDLVILRNGSRLSILGNHERWYRVRAGTSTGFMHHSWVHVDQYESGPFGQRHVQIKSADNLGEVESFVRSSRLPLAAYMATNGWYAITIEGTYGQDDARELLSGLKRSGSIPDDSFTTYGTTYVRKICCE